MEDPNSITAISSRAGDPLQWLTEYLRHRAHLASSRSDFRCDPACTRPGCKNLDLQVPVTLVDLLGAALHRQESISTIFPDNYSLGLLSEGREDWIRTVSLRLKKPCPFLAHDLCGIYEVRPLPCILFPEYLAQEGAWAENAGQDHFRDYLCLHRPFLLSPQRAQVITQIRAMWERERLISSYYLFNHGSCRLDFGNLIQELLHEAESQRKGEPGEEPAPLRIIPNQVMERYFLEHIAGCPPFAGVSEKIHELHNREGQEEFLQLFQDDRLWKKLKRDGDGAHVFRFAKGKLQARRRSLSPAEYKFY